MSLISCPECGQSVSSLAEKCVHCGCKINTCSECGTVWAGDKTTCPECGYEVETKGAVHEKVSSDSQRNSEGNRANSSSMSHNPYRSYQNMIQGGSDPFLNVNKKRISSIVYKNIPMGQRFVANIFSHLSWMVLVVMFTIILIWPNSIEMVFRTDEIATLCRILVVVSYICLAIGEIYGSYKRSILINNGFVTYLQNNNVDLKGRIRKMYDCDWLKLTAIEKRMRIVNVDYCMQIALKCDTPTYEVYPGKTYMQNHRSKKSVCSEGIVNALASLPLFALLFWAVEEVFMKIAFLGFERAWEDIKGNPIIIYVLLGCLLWFYRERVLPSVHPSYYGYVKKREKSSRAIVAKWVEQNIPDQLENYEAYNSGNLKNIKLPIGNVKRVE